MKKLENKSWLEYCEKLVFALLCVLMADCCIFGAGRTIMVGPVGFRMALVALTLLVSVPMLVRDFWILVQKRVLWFFGILAAWLLFQAIRGIANDPSVWAVDVKGYCYFFMLLPAICVLNSKHRIHKLMKVMLYASATLAVAALLLTYWYKCNHALFVKIYFMDPQELILDLSPLIDKIVPRLYFRSTNYLLAGCAFSIYFFAAETGKFRWHYPVITGLCLFGMLVSYTRAVYLAAFITAAVVTVVFLVFGFRKIRMEFWKHLIAATLVFAVITVGLGAIVGTNYIEHGIRRVVATFGTEEETTNQVPVVSEKTENTIQVVSLSNVIWTEEPTKEQNNAEMMTTGSDMIRADTLQELNAWIQMAPILGHGLGKGVACRYDGLTEYVYHEMVMKTGIVGLLIYMLPVLWLILSMVDQKHLSKPNKLIAGCWLAVLLGYMGFSYYNPYMNASLGILFYCCTVGVFVNLKCNITKEKTYE